jgi:hypothetical protein
VVTSALLCLIPSPAEPGAGTRMRLLQRQKERAPVTESPVSSSVGSVNLSDRDAHGEDDPHRDYRVDRGAGDGPPPRDEARTLPGQGEALCG